MPTEAPPTPAPGPELKIGDLPRSGNRTEMPNSILEAAQAASRKASGEPEPPTPPPDPAPAPKPPVKPNGEPAEPVKPPTTPTAEPKPAKSDKEENIVRLREKAEKSEREAAEARNSATATAKEKADADLKLAEANAKLAAALEREEKDYKPRVARLEQAEKEIQKTQEILKIKAYQETDEFHDKFIKPLADARAEATEMLSELVVNENGVARAATQQDFDEILSARSVNEAAELARQKFGDLTYQSAVNLRQRIRSLERSRQEAVKNAALAAEEYEKRRQSEFAQHREATTNRLKSETARYIEAEPDVFNVPEDDVELRNSLIEGQTLADRLLNGDPNMTHEQFISEIAKGRKDIMAAPVLRKKLSKANEKIASLEAQLKEYQKSEPDVQTRNGGPTPQGGSGDEAKDKLLAAANAMATRRT